MPNSKLSGDALFGIVTCNSRFAVAEQVCAWQAPLPPPAPPAALPEWELTYGGWIHPTLKCTRTNICASAVKIYCHKLSFLFATWGWTSLWRRRARSSGVGRHGRRHRLDDVRRVQRVPVHANESPRRGRRSESARRRHYPGCRAGRGEERQRYSFCFTRTKRDRERLEFAKGSTDRRRSAHFFLTHRGLGGQAGRGRPEGGMGGGRWARPYLPPSLAPLLRWVQPARAASRVRNGAIHCVSSIFRRVRASERGEKED